MMIWGYPISGNHHRTIPVWLQFTIHSTPIAELTKNIIKQYVLPSIDVEFANNVQRISRTHRCQVEHFLGAVQCERFSKPKWPGRGRLSQALFKHGDSMANSWGSYLAIGPLGHPFVVYFPVSLHFFGASTRTSH